MEWFRKLYKTWIMGIDPVYEENRTNSGVIGLWGPPDKCPRCSSKKVVARVNDGGSICGCMDCGVNFPGLPPLGQVHMPSAFTCPKCHSKNIEQANPNQRLKGVVKFICQVCNNKFYNEYKHN